MKEQVKDYTQKQRVYSFKHTPVEVTPFCNLGALEAADSKGSTLLAADVRVINDSIKLHIQIEGCIPTHSSASPPGWHLPFLARGER